MLAALTALAGAASAVPTAAPATPVPPSAAPADPAVHPNPAEERTMTTPADRPPRSSSRIRAPQVAPLERSGVRYEPVSAASSEGLAPGIYVKATETATGKRLWTACLHTTVYDPNREKDVQNVFLRALAFDSGVSTLTAEDERGRRWRIELASGAVTELKTP